MSRSYTRDEILAKAGEILGGMNAAQLAGITRMERQLAAALAAVFPDDPPPVVVRDEFYDTGVYRVNEQGDVEVRDLNRWAVVKTPAGVCLPEFLRFVADLKDWPFLDPVTGRPCKADRTLRPVEGK